MYLSVILAIFSFSSSVSFNSVFTLSLRKSEAAVGGWRMGPRLPGGWANAGEATRTNRPAVSRLAQTLRIVRLLQVGYMKRGSE